MQLIQAPHSYRAKVRVTSYRTYSINAFTVDQAGDRVIDDVLSGVETENFSIDDVQVEIDSVEQY